MTLLPSFRWGKTWLTLNVACNLIARFKVWTKFNTRIAVLHLVPGFEDKVIIMLPRSPFLFGEAPYKRSFLLSPLSLYIYIYRLGGREPVATSIGRSYCKKLWIRYSGTYVLSTYLPTSLPTIHHFIWSIICIHRQCSTEKRLIDKCSAECHSTGRRCGYHVPMYQR